jgi:hypothetical protein
MDLPNLESKLSLIRTGPPQLLMDRMGGQIVSQTPNGAVENVLHISGIPEMWEFWPDGIREVRLSS